jgi:hypothetical protein
VPKAVLANVSVVMAGNSPFAPGPLRIADSAATAHIPVPVPSGRAEQDSREPPRQPAFPPLTTQAANLFSSVVSFIGDGCALVDDAEYRRRLMICHACDRRVGRRCAECACWIGVKARGRAFHCPLEQWKV